MPDQPLVCGTMSMKPAADQMMPVVSMTRNLRVVSGCVPVSLAECSCEDCAFVTDRLAMQRCRPERLACCVDGDRGGLAPAGTSNGAVTLIP